MAADPAIAGSSPAGAQTVIRCVVASLTTV